MKKTHLFALVIIAVAIGVIIAKSGDYSRYETFESAAKKAGKEVHVVGVLAEGKEMEYDPLVDPNHFVFYMQDSEGQEHKVVYPGPKPRDFERSDQIVLTGRMESDHFSASKILMKCPSKYVEDEVAVSEVKGGV